MSALFMLPFIVTIGVAKTIDGYRWSRLDQNPWANAPLGGLFSGPGPGLLPRHLTVAQINARGRRAVITAPIVTLLVCLFYLHTFHYF
ncbi:hypothetical protein SAQ01S_20350 [Sphingomonas aquatilis NBRC 16722]|jgi:hypothetical protein|uniref:Uncharacterized protein n=1 Tax=Sphingomonas aquatilis TaxID=93063 RepID=A0AAW3TT23_9SPHN|nr:hypothetical protein [Sphingomonas aquatilis]MBB3875841.1 hypothetical protein [Sphingomonas aquatilis]GEM72269.1 hypothetical protein SAQ01S_20350 [Sphingomonas aquatilis NBRC 16722]